MRKIFKCLSPEWLPTFCYRCKSNRSYWDSFQFSQSILFLLLLSLLLFVFFLPFPTFNKKVKPNKKEAKRYNPNGRKIPEKNSKKNVKRNTQCTIS